MKNKAGTIVSLKKAVSIARLSRAHGKKLVVLSGSFDLLHSGHLFLIQKAASYGDVLLVLMNTDKSVKRYKGPQRPIVPEDERARMVAGVTGVDYVALFDDINPKKVLEQIKPAVYCNGSDWGKNCIERELIDRNGGVVKIIPKVPGFSTTKLIESIVRTAKDTSSRAVFLDRDGTINDNGSGYIHIKEDIVFMPGVIEGLKALSKTDYKLIIVTNQSGIAHGYHTEQQVHTLHRWLIATLKKKGIRIDRAYHCPHGPEDGCICRKPGIGMFEDAVKHFGISLAKSWFVGDASSDVIAGREANIQTIKLGKKMDAHLKLEPNYYVRNLKEAAAIILKNS